MVEMGQCGKFVGCLFSITRNCCHCPKIFSSQDFSTQQHQPLPLPIRHLLTKKIPVAVSSKFLYATMEGLPVTVACYRCQSSLAIVHCHCLSAVAHGPLPICRCPSAVGAVAWTWDSDAIFSGCLFSEIFFMEMEQ